MSNIGFIGLGIMGKPMSKNLLKAGHSLVVYDIVPELLDARGGGRRGARRVLPRRRGALGDHHHHAARRSRSGTGGARSRRRAGRRAPGLDSWST